MLTFILVHGALLTSSAWMPVQSYLQNHGYNVVTIDVPGRAGDHINAKDVTLNLAVDKLCRVVNLQNNRVILVGHSQGGAIITEATNQCGANIAGLVYVAAVVPENGEKVFELLNETDGANFDKVATVNPDTGTYEINYQGPIKEVFMEDATDNQAKQAIADLVPEPARLGDEVLRYDTHLFSEIPKFYIRTTLDKIISPDTQKKYIARTHFDHVLALRTGHSPFVSEADKLGQYLINIYGIIES